MSGEKNLKKLITSMTPVLCEEEYIFGSLVRADLGLLASLDPLGTFREEEGLTVIVQKNKADEHKIEYSGIFKCITLNVHSSLDAVGLTAAVATKLTESNISANVVAAFFHDHIFISSKDAVRALNALKQLTQDGD
ncbi:MAG: hypothetical protein ACI808_002861 [Paraglaciecola sp.]|jgi:hypothetical protein